MQDSTAIAQLYTDYSSAIYSRILRIVPCKETAEQILQDTFLKAWQKKECYDESKGRIFTWLLIIAQNTALDATRNAHYRYSKKTIPLQALYNDPCGKSPNTDTLGIREIVQKMDAKHSRLINLVYFEGCTQHEASETTSLPLGTVKSRLRNALFILKKGFDSESQIN
jgi:RNA polymerase sigma factor (sigma-70 family)